MTTDAEKVINKISQYEIAKKRADKDKDDNL